MNKRARKKALNRAAQNAPLVSPQYAPGGALMYVPPGYAQSILGQTYYGTTLKNAPAQWTSLFSPGVPLPPQPTVNPNGLPVQFKYMPAYNTFPVDRTMGNPDIPSFQTLRQLAKMYSGITLCERAWLDMVPRMDVKIGLRPEYVAAGAEEQDYRKEITFFTNFFSKPDGQRDLHTWLRMVLRDQTQIDELYLYKDKTRGGKLLGLQVVDGAQMKPLLDDWGHLPPPPKYAYQQYPWGIPGWQYTTDQLIHYQETPASDTPYGFSRVERFILEVNQALRKKKKDLSYFTEGNIPQSFMEVPESLQWTPDQIDSYEQSWNALLAGNVQQQVRVKFMQPGMKYTPVDQYQLMTDFDKFLLNIACASYGLSMSELGFTEDVNRASGESQEDMTYRRTIGPLASMYSLILSDVMAHDFPEEMHGDMLMLTFTGFDEADDLGELATAYSTLTNAGILGITNASKLLQLPEDPDAPHIGRVFMSKDGPVFLDDMAAADVRKAALQAKMAGFQLATNPPTPEDESTNEDAEDLAQSTKPEKQPAKKTLSRVEQALASIDEQLRLLRAHNVTPEEPVLISQQGTCTCAICTGNHGRHMAQGEAQPPYHDGCDCTMVPKGEARVTRPQENAEDEAGRTRHMERRVGDVARERTQPETVRDGASGPDSKEVSAEFRRWRARAIEDAKQQRPWRGFTSAIIPEYVWTYISRELEHCQSADDVRALFVRVRGVQESELIGGEPLLEYDAQKNIWEPDDVAEQLEQYLARGAAYLQWETGVSASGVCATCAPNDKEIREVGKAFSSGHRLPQAHIHCQCRVVALDREKRVIA